MIAHLMGRVLEKAASEVVLDVGGVGYRVHLSAASATRLPPEGADVRLRIQTVVREDAIELFGFLSRQEEELFLLLTSVSQVGPKLAMNVLSGMEVDALARALAGGDVARLTQIHGVGKKTAERLVLELRDKVKGVVKGAPGEGAVPAGGARTDLVSALVNLGYRPSQAETAAANAVRRTGDQVPFEALLREALKGLRSAS